MVLLEQPQHALARRRRIVVRDDRLLAMSPSHLTPVGERVRRRHQQHELVAADRHFEQPSSADETSARRSRGCPAALRPAI
jgi:hypothetical protein